MDDSLGRRAPASPGRHAAGRRGKDLATTCLDELGAAGYWGLLVDKRIWRLGSAVRQLRPVSDPDGHGRSDGRRPGLACTAASARSIRCARSATPSRRAASCPGLASGERLSAFALTEPSAGSDLTALRTRRRAATATNIVVNGEKLFITNVVPGRTIGLVCLIDDRPAVLVVDLPDAGERALPTARNTGCTRSSTRTTRGSCSAISACRPPTCCKPVARRRADDRLSRAEPGPHCAVRERRRHDAADAGQHDPLGPVPQNLRRGRSPAASWCAAGWAAWPG